MAFLDIVLKEPSYGWKNEAGTLSKPLPGVIFREFLHRVNIFRSRKNWLAFSGWFGIFLLSPLFFIFIFHYFQLWYALAAFGYGMIIMGSHGTVWYHRYGTHHAFTFSNKVARFITQHLVIKLIPEETYVVSHHVHHAKSDEPGDPYNAQGGFLYCFMADTNHQVISPDLSESDYQRVSGLLEHTPLKRNSYQEYLRWGSIANPYYTWLSLLLNWISWYAIFYLIGGHALATALFSGALVWGVGVRTFNFEGHGKGKDKRKPGFDFDASNYSINQYWPGFVAGEWHNNHHLFPSSARSGFLPGQIDLAWYYIRFLKTLGGVSSVNNSKHLFYQKYYLPYRSEPRRKGRHRGAERPRTSR